MEKPPVLSRGLSSLGGADSSTLSFGFCLAPVDLSYCPPFISTSFYSPNRHSNLLSMLTALLEG